MVKLKDLVCKTVEIDGKKVAKTAAFMKTYFDFGPDDATEEKEKQFGGVKMEQKIVVPKEKKSKHSTVSLFADMVSFLDKRFAPEKPIKVEVVLECNETTLQYINEYVTAAYDVAERQPVALSLIPVDADKAYQESASKLLAVSNGKVVNPFDPTVELTTVEDVITLLKSFSAKK